jgi:voltage-gated potassium channel
MEQIQEHSKPVRIHLWKNSSIAFDGMKISIRRRKYEILLISFLLLMFGDACVPIRFSGTTHFILLLQNMIVGLIVFYRILSLRYLILITIILSLLLRALDQPGGQSNFDFHTWRGILYILYFLVITGKVYKDIFLAKAISLETISAVLCGLILLCQLGTFLFYQIEVAHPHSFSGLGQNNLKLSDLNYFSITTITTTGFGDILPVTHLAKKAVMLFCFAGHFYSVFVTGIIIGKYISRNGNKI